MCLAPKATLCRAKYLLLFVRKYRTTCLRLCTHLRRQLRRSFHLDLDLDFNLSVHPSLHRTLHVALLLSLLPAFFAALLGSMLVAKNPQFLVLPRPALRSPKLRGRHRRGPGGKCE